ncbi:unnamed protein product [Ranitomeya imitator]|uniref:Uncharacterized protein n=1 Tax=Ranitomeya imitator TaxID=111125 RepID=A0ABN9L554_9NEOB|nr:unnamed protein product [Ranitomeya imitator]
MTAQIARCVFTTTPLRHQRKAEEEPAMSPRPPDLTSLIDRRKRRLCNRAGKSESLPSVAGIGMGIQDVRSMSIVPVTKTPKTSPSLSERRNLGRVLSARRSSERCWEGMNGASAPHAGGTALTVALSPARHTDNIRVRYVFYTDPLTLMDPCAPTNTDMSPCFPNGHTVRESVSPVSSNEETLFLSKLEALEKEILSLKSSLKDKEELVTGLNETIKTKTAQFTRDIEHEVSDHKTTRQTLGESQRIVREKEQLLQESILHYDKVIRERQDQHEEMMAKFKEQSQRDVNARDERISKLKQQISELFKDKSWEHQKQIEELQKELKRLAEEAQECKKCQLLMSALEDGRLQLKLKNRTIEELQSICQRFQQQLQEQGTVYCTLHGKQLRNRSGKTAAVPR